METKKKFDFSRIEELEKQLEAEKERYNFVKDMLDCGLWEYEIKTGKLVQNKEMSQGRSSGTIENYRQTIKNSGSIYPADVPVFDKFVDSMDKGEAVFSYDLRMDIGTGKFVWLRFDGYMVRGVDGMPEKVVGRTTNIDSEKNADTVVIKKAESDTATGLLNEEAFVSRLSSALTVGEKGSKHAFVIIEINNKFAIGKQWGEAYYEYVVDTFGNALSSNFKTNQIVAKLKDGCFAMFIQGVESVKAINETAAAIEKLGSEIKFKREHELSLKMGISVFPIDGSDYSTLSKKAYTALGTAKLRLNKNVEFYSKQLNDKQAEAPKEEPKPQADTTTEARKIIKEQKESEYGKVERHFADRIMEMLASDEANPAEINALFAEIGKYYKYTRIYTYNFDKRGNTCFIKYFWNERPIPYMRVYERIVDAQWEKVIARFKNDKLFICENSASLDFEVPAELANVFQPGALFQYKVFEDEHAITCITFEAPVGTTWSKEEEDFLINISRLLSIYMERIRTRDNLKKEIEYSRDVMNNQMVTDYAVYKDSYKLVFVGDANGRQYVAEEDNLLCYKTVMGRKEPCRNCPLTGIREGRERCSMENYFENNKKWFTSTATAVKHGDEEFDFICWTDVTAFVDRMKSKDILTGQLTAERFEQIVESKISVMRKPQNLFVYFNIPDFSLINDLWGYSICDEVLILYSRAVQEQLKPDELLARVTGSTFVMFLDYDDKDRAQARIEMMLQQAIASVHRMYPDVQLTSWAGVHRMNGHGMKIPEMIEAANTARKSIANRLEKSEVDVAFYNDVIKTGATFEDFIRNNMKQAFENKEFRVFFQPVRDDDGEIVKADVVVRWITKEGTVIEKESFTAIMAEEGVIEKLDAYTHEETFRLLAQWLERDLEPPLISLACSQQYMFSPEFMNRTKELLKQYPVPTKLVEFVIPEGVNEGNFFRVVSILQELQTMGFVISLDSYMTKFALNSMRSVKMLEENPGLKKLDDIQVEIKGNKPLEAEDFETVFNKDPEKQQ